jgi:hypothetical protein
MLDADAKCVITGLHVMETNIVHAAGQQPVMTAEYVLVAGGSNNTQIQTRAQGTCKAPNSHWSPKTRELLQDLIESMETDLLPRHFEVREGMEEDNERTQLGGVERTPQI